MTHRIGPRSACALAPAECFAKQVTARAVELGLKRGKDGWWSMQCPGHHRGPPLRLKAGDYAHIVYHDIGGCPDAIVFAGLTGLGLPAACLRKPKGGKPTATRQDSALADTILDIALGEGTATERIIRITIAALDGEQPEGPIVDALAASLRVSPASIYRATAEVRRKDRKWQAEP